MNKQQYRKLRDIFNKRKTSEKLFERFMEYPDIWYDAIDDIINIGKYTKVDNYKFKDQYEKNVVCGIMCVMGDLKLGNKFKEIMGDNNISICNIRKVRYLLNNNPNLPICSAEQFKEFLWLAAGYIMGIYVIIDPIPEFPSAGIWLISMVSLLAIERIVRYSIDKYHQYKDRPPGEKDEYI